MATVALRGLTRRYEGGQTALNALDLRVEDGELLVLVGPSGCGKSTALRLIAGLDTPDAGSIAIDDRDVTALPPQDRDVAMVFQGYALYPHMTARQNMEFSLEMRGVKRDERARRVREAAAMLGLDKLLDRRPAELSGGERQRVAMGRAIVRAPKLFLFDEPLSNLDAALRSELRVEIAALVKRLGVTSIYVTHDQVEAMTMGDRIAVLRNGELLQVGPPRAIYEDPASLFVARFLGSPPINVIDLARDGGEARGAGAAWPVPEGIELPAHPMCACAAFRPEHARIGSSDKTSLITISAEVTAVEPLGAETHLTCGAHGATIRAKAPGFDAPSRGERVTITVDPSRVLFFDRGSGRRLRARP